MINIIPDEVPELVPESQILNDPRYGAKSGKLGHYVGKNVFVTLLDGSVYVGLCLEANELWTYTVGHSQPIPGNLVESVREV